jgi:hypothetical protein
VEQRRPLARVLVWFWIGSVAAVVLTLLVAWLKSRTGAPQNQWDPLFEPRFGDLLEYVPTFHFVHTEAFYGNPYTSSVAYPPFGGVLCWLLYSFGHPVVFYLTIAAAALGFALWKIARAMHATGLSWAVSVGFPLTVALCSFPLAGLLQRGNVELLVLIFSTAGTWAFLNDRNELAAVLWACAAGGKLYPIIYLSLLLGRRKFVAFVLGVVAFVGISVACMVWLGPTLASAWRGSLKNVFGYQGIRVSEWTMHELATNHSFFGLVKFGAVLVGGSFAKLTLPYYGMGVLLFVAVYFGRMVRMPAANQVMFVTLYMVMLPTISYYYTLTNLYVPWLLLVFVALRSEEPVRGLRRTLLLFLPVFAAYTIFTYGSVYLFGGLIQAFVLALLLGCAVLFRFADPFPSSPGK